jgi:DNA replication protein DnaC
LLKETMNATPPPTLMLNRQQVLELDTCNYIRQKRNVLICGPTSVGKTLLAQALVHEACRPDLDALFINGLIGRSDKARDRR